MFTRAKTYYHHKIGRKPSTIETDVDETLHELFRDFNAYGAGQRAKDAMDNRTFAKFAKDCCLIDRKLTETEVDMIFTKVKPVRQRVIVFSMFQEGLRQMAAVKGMTYAEIVQISAMYGGPASNKVTETVQGGVTRFHDDISTYTGTHSRVHLHANATSGDPTSTFRPGTSEREDSATKAAREKLTRSMRSAKPAAVDKSTDRAAWLAARYSVDQPDVSYHQGDAGVVSTPSSLPLEKSISAEEARETFGLYNKGASKSKQGKKNKKVWGKLRQGKKDTAKDSWQVGGIQHEQTTLRASFFSQAPEQGKEEEEEADSETDEMEIQDMQKAAVMKLQLGRYQSAERLIAKTAKTTRRSQGGDQNACAANGCTRIHRYTDGYCNLHAKQAKQTRKMNRASRLPHHANSALNRHSYLTPSSSADKRGGDDEDEFDDEDEDGADDLYDEDGADDLYDEDGADELQGDGEGDAATMELDMQAMMLSADAIFEGASKADASKRPTWITEAITSLSAPSAEARSRQRSMSLIGPPAQPPSFVRELSDEGRSLARASSVSTRLEAEDAQAIRHSVCSDAPVMRHSLSRSASMQSMSSLRRSDITTSAVPMDPPRSSSPLVPVVVPAVPAVPVVPVGSPTSGPRFKLDLGGGTPETAAPGGEVVITVHELRAFFAVHNPSKIVEAQKLLAGYEGQHHTLRDDLQSKYNATIGVGRTNATTNAASHHPGSGGVSAIDVDNMGVSQLRALITSSGHPNGFSDCIEKSELRERAREALQLH
jgi:hypothetical protein